MAHRESGVVDGRGDGVGRRLPVRYGGVRTDPNWTPPGTLGLETNLIFYLK